MQIFVCRHGFYVFGKAKEVCQLLRQYALEYATVKDLINHRLN